jgi:hypothetical protein
MRKILCAIIILSTNAYAQDKPDTADSTDKMPAKKRKELYISNKGISVKDADKPGTEVKVEQDNEENDKFLTYMASMDLGLNTLRDNTNKTTTAPQILNVSSGMRNRDLFRLRTSKSINVNIYPCMFRMLLVKTTSQRIFFSTGLGLQLYNFSYEQPLIYRKDPNGIFLPPADSVRMKKDKLALDYLNVPLMFTFKTKIHKGTWLVYGGGITEGYRIASWTKMVSGAYGKQKNRGSFGLEDFNTCVTGELGIDGMFRVYASYQLTSLYSSGTGLDQHPFSFGIRFFGM